MRGDEVGKQIVRDELAAYLDGCRKRSFWKRIEAALDAAKAMRVAFVGETIIDEYVFVKALGKASKEYALAVTWDGEEAFGGGVIAAARHALKLCGEVRTVTHDETAIVKQRFVARDFNQKLFEVYSCDRMQLDDEQRTRFHDRLYQATQECDVVIVLDFGHGLFGGYARSLVNGAKFIAVNAQTNAANHGFNTALRYRLAHYLCVDAPEARIAAQMQHEPIAEVVARLSHDPAFRQVIVTHGKDGAYVAGTPIVQVPAFTKTPKDTMGAGDCFLAVTAPLVAAGLGLEEAALVGNVAAAMKTEIVGHREPIDGDELVRTVKNLLA